MVQALKLNRISNPVTKSGNHVDDNSNGGEVNGETDWRKWLISDMGSNDSADTKRNNGTNCETEWKKKVCFVKNIGENVDPASQRSKKDKKG